MNKKRMVILALASVLGMGAAGQMAQARSGMAAYNEHTGAMVTAARYEPYGSMLRVTNPRNGNSVLVRVNDRGPFNGGRILDLSTGAFSQLFGGLGRGTGPISYEVVGGSGGLELAARGGSPRWRSHRHSRHARWHHRRHWR